VPVAPRGVIAAAERALGATLCGLSAFQEYTRATTAAEAANHVFYQGLPPKPPEAAEYTQEMMMAIEPTAIIWTQSEGNGLAWDSTAGDGIKHSGRLCVRLFRACPDNLQSNVADEDQDWVNLLGLIGQELMEASACRTPGTLDVVRVVLADGPWRTPEEEEAKDGRWQGAILIVEWGTMQ
jgi:hypothetical protein